jgi:hypothetical protein
MKFVIEGKHELRGLRATAESIISRSRCQIAKAQLTNVRHSNAQRACATIQDLKIKRQELL